MTTKQNEWRNLVKQTYHKNKKLNKNYKFSQALKDASRLKNNTLRSPRKTRRRTRRR